MKQTIQNLMRSGITCAHNQMTIKNAFLMRTLLAVALIISCSGHVWADDVTYEWDATGTVTYTNPLSVTAAKGTSSASYWKGYNFGTDMTKAIKMESSTTITFSVTSGTIATVFIGISTKDNTAVDAAKSTVKFDGTLTEQIITDNQTKSTGTYTYKTIELSNIKAGTHTISQGGCEMGVYYIKVVESPIKITYDLNGHGTNYDVTDVTTIPTSLPTPKADGFTFDGWWNTSACNDTQYKGGEEISENTTLYAKWLESIGEKDVSYNTRFSSTHTLSAGKSLHIGFKNVSYGTDVWDNWILAANPTNSTKTINTSTYTALRADNYDNINSNNTVHAITCKDINTNATIDPWTYFQSDMKDADVSIDISFSGTRFYMKAVTTTSNREYTYTAETPAITEVSSADIFLTCENASLNEITFSSETDAYTVTATTDGNGTVTMTNGIGMAVTGGSTMVHNGESIIYTATANEGYSLLSWDDGSTDISITKTITSGIGPIASFQNANAPFAITSTTAHEVGTVLNKNANLEVTLGGWVYSGGSRTDHAEGGEKADGWKSPSAAITGHVDGFDYGITGNQDPLKEDDLSPGKKPESSEKNSNGIDYTTSIIDPMFYVPAAGTYFIFAPKVNGTVKAHVTQTGLFAKKVNNGGNDYTYEDTRRVMIIDEEANSIIKDATATLDYDKAGMIDDLTNLPTFTGWTTDWGNAKNKYNDITGLEYDENNQLTSFKNGLFEFTKESGYATLVEAPVTYEFDAKAGKSYFIYLYGGKLTLNGFEFTPATVETTKLELTQETDAATTASKLEEAKGKMVKVSLDRTFKGGVWNACVLPFSMNKQQVEEVFGTLYDKNTPSGTEILYFDRIEGNTLYFFYHAPQTIVAGKPFLIKPSKSDEKIKLDTSIDGFAFPYVTIENTVPDVWGKPGSKYWYSSYGSQNVQAGDYYIGATSGDLIRYNRANTTMNGYRGFLKIGDGTIITSSSQAKAMTISIENNLTEDDTATNISKLILDSEGNIREVPSNGKVYNLNGQAVINDASKLYELPAGIYIVNGKKYIVK